MRVAATAGAALVTLLLAAGCGDNEGPTRDGESPDRATATPVTTTYVPPWVGKDIEAEFNAAAAEEDSRPTFDGLRAGFNFRALQDDGSADVHFPCEVTERVKSEVLTFGYLPGGTVMNDPGHKEETGRCGDGTVAWIWRDFYYSYGTISMSVQFPTKDIVSHSSASRMQDIEVGGKPAVLVNPILPDGFGASELYFHLGSALGILEVDGLPAEETIRIAEAVSCAAC